MDLKLHLLLPAVLSLFIISLILMGRKWLFHRNKILWQGVLLFFTIYLLIVGGAYLMDLNLAYKASQMEDVDGMIDYQSLTLEQKKDWDSYINDTGRNFSFIVGLIFSGAITIFFFLAASLDKYLRRKNTP